MEIEETTIHDRVEARPYSKEDKRFWFAILATSLGSILALSNLYFVQPLLPLFVQDFNIL